MKVAVEIPYYAYGARGASQYGENLVRALGQASPRDQFVAFNYFYGDYERHLARIAKLKAPNVEVFVPRWPQRLVDAAETVFGYPFVENRFLRPQGVEVFHSAGQHPVLSTPAVVTFHGAAMDMFYGLDRFFTQKTLPQLKRTSRVIVDSVCLRDVLLKYTDVDPARIRVVYLGVDHALFRPGRPAAELEALRLKRALPERFLLCVGPFQFRDNIEHLLCVLKRAGEAAPFKGLKLVLAGGLEEHGQSLARRVRELGLEDRVVFSGYVPHAELAVFYNLAEAYVHLSYFEELGCQLLEAAASGAPIVAARTGGIEEAAGDAAAYFNPARLDELEAALRRVLESAALRQELGAQAAQRSHRFSWDAAARQTLEIYREAAANLL